MAKLTPSEESQRLRSKYPRLFRKGISRYDFSIYNGWFEIIDQLCADITKEMDKLPFCAYFQVDQVKEKFGGLRFYYSGPNFDTFEFNGIYLFIWNMIAWCLRWNKQLETARHTINNLVSAAEKQCWKVCEDCGAPGSRGGIGWIKTLCDDCQESLEREAIQRGGIDRARSALITEMGADKWFALSREKRTRLVKEMNKYLQDKQRNQKPHF